MAAVLLLVAALAATPAVAPAKAPAKSPVVIACNLPPRALPALQPGPGGERVFRLSPGSIQAWDATRRGFGENLCGAYTCTRTANKTEATISSASVSYTIGLANGQGYWKALGASGGGPRSGACRIVTAQKP